MNPNINESGIISVVCRQDSFLGHKDCSIPLEYFSLFWENSNAFFATICLNCLSTASYCRFFCSSHVHDAVKNWSVKNKIRHKSKFQSWCNKGQMCVWGSDGALVHRTKRLRWPLNQLLLVCQSRAHLFNQFSLVLSHHGHTCSRWQYDLCLCIPHAFCMLT